MEAASKPTTDHATLSFAGLVLCIIGGSILILYGMLQLSRVISNEQDALHAIIGGCLLLGFSGIMYEYTKFRITAFSLIRKLINGGGKT